MRRAIKKRVLLIEEDKSILERVVRLFVRDTSYIIISTSNTIEDCFEKIDIVKPDVIFYNNRNASYNLNELKNVVFKTLPKCKFESTFNVLEMKFNRIFIDFDSFYEQALEDLKVNPEISNYSKYILIDPEINIMETEISLEERSILYKNFICKVSDILLSIGVPINTCGYKYLREAIMVGIDTPIGVVSVTKNIYPNVAFKFHTTADCVERAIRTSLDQAWKNNGYEHLLKALDLEDKDLNDPKPSNSKFISLVVDRLRLDILKFVD